MRVVEAAQLTDGGEQRLEFCGVGANARGVGRDPVAVGVRTVQPVEVLPHRAPVPVEVVRVGVPAGDLLADAVQGGLVDGCVGQAVLAEQFRGDALAELGVVVGVDQQLQVGVRVHVDESRAEHQAGAVDHRAGSGERARFGERPRHGDPSDQAAGDGDVRGVTGLAGAVHDDDVADHGAGHLAPLRRTSGRCRRRRGRPGRQRCRAPASVSTCPTRCRGATGRAAPRRRVARPVRRSSAGTHADRSPR